MHCNFHWPTLRTYTYNYILLNYVLSNNTTLEVSVLIAVALMLEVVQ